MLLRRVIGNVKEQNWVAVVIDFFIVVVGVFIGIQVANWNDARSDDARELILLKALRVEVADSVRQTKAMVQAYEDIAAAGIKSVAYLDAQKQCEKNCVQHVVNFFHASQWQPIGMTLPTYQELLRNGWPKNRKIFTAANGYMRRVNVNSRPFEVSPAYRDLVRGLIPLSFHAPYWSTCFQLVNGEEVYVSPCNLQISDEEARKGLTRIANEPDLYRTLVEWTGYVQSLGQLTDQNEAAGALLRLIDEEIGTRQ